MNNAGLLQPIGLAWEVDPDAWWRCVEVNLRGPYLCARAVLPGMVARRAGRIVNIASVAAAAPIPDGTAYASSKAALVRLTDSLAAETAEYGVGVFAVDPGNVATGMHAYLGQSPAWLKRRGRHAPPYTAGGADGGARRRASPPAGPTRSPAASSACTRTWTSWCARPTPSAKTTAMPSASAAEAAPIPLPRHPPWEEEILPASRLGYPPPGAIANRTPQGSQITRV